MSFKMPPRAFVVAAVVMLGAAACHRTTPPAAVAPAFDPVRAPARLFPGLGNLHHPITTSSPEAQRFFDQGLTLVYAFNFREALHDFQHAAELDPSAAMPYWGMALAYGPNFNGASVNLERAALGEQAIASARDRATKASASERDYIEAMSERFSTEAKPNQAALAASYANNMQALTQRYPDDPDAATLFAEALMDEQPWHLWQDGKPFGNTELIVSTLEAVIKRWPDHLGANHLYMHALEASPFPERALPSARRLPGLAPAAGHIVHMPAHIDLAMGEYAAAAAANVDAIAADRAYLPLRTTENTNYQAGYVDHNFLFLAAAAGMDGDANQAIDAATQLAAQPGANADAFRSARYFTLVRFARWNDILALPAPAINLPTVNFIWHYARANAFARSGQAKSAQTELDAMEEINRQMPANRTFGPPSLPFSTIHSLAVAIVRARIAAIGDDTAAIAAWRAALKVYDTIGYHEPPAWYPVRESLGAALLHAGQVRAAATVFRDELRMHPHNPRALFGLAQALAGSAEGDQAQREFLAGWKGDPRALNLDNF